MNKRISNKYIPMTETAYYILLSLRQERHGYGIMQHVTDLTEGRLKLGAGTLYGTLSKMEADGLITPINALERRKTYQQTELGQTILDIEIQRLKELLKSSEKEMEGLS